MSPLFLVSNLDNATNFYTKILGFEISFSYDDFYCGLVKDSCSIHLKSGSPSAEERIKRRTNEDIDITFTIDNIEAAYEYIKNTTVTIIQPLRHMPYGSEFYISDPDGYILAFLRTA